MRRVPERYSWIDQRLVRDRHLDRLDTHAAALYLFLATVADARGLSWYGDASIARRLSMDVGRLRRARGDLVRAGLLAHVEPLYQVLSLDGAGAGGAHAVAVQVPKPASAALPATGREAALGHLAALRAALGRRP